MTTSFLELEISIILASVSKKPLLDHLSQFYQHDIAPFFDDSIKNLPNEKGLYDPLPHLDEYWTDKNRFPFLISYKERPIGFVLVNKVATESSTDWNMAEFFIISSCRRKGMGRYVAQQIIQKFPGAWEIAVLLENKPAYFFWKSIVDQISSNRSAC